VSAAEAILAEFIARGRPGATADAADEWLRGQ
jgi:hypothetical protein